MLLSGKASGGAPKGRTVSDGAGGAGGALRPLRRAPCLCGRAGRLLLGAPDEPCREESGDVQGNPFPFLGVFDSLGQRKEHTFFLMSVWFFVRRLWQLAAGVCWPWPH